MEENIENVLFPNNGILEKDKNGTLTAVIVDDELDPVNCTFNNDGCIELNTKGYNTLSLSIDTLYQMIDLIEEAEEQYDYESGDESEDESEDDE